MCGSRTKYIQLLEVVFFATRRESRVPTISKLAISPVTTLSHGGGYIRERRRQPFPRLPAQPEFGSAFALECWRRPPRARGLRYWLSWFSACSLFSAILWPTAFSSFGGQAVELDSAYSHPVVSDTIFSSFISFGDSSPNLHHVLVILCVCKHVMF